MATSTKSTANATATTKLPKSVFAVEIKNHQMLKDSYLAYLANGRENLAQTLNRGQVSGGGKKPWRQKGTGRARFGSSRNPIWRGGGIAFGPTGNETYTRKVNIKVKQLALKQALTLASQENRISIIDTFACKEGKVKETKALLDKMRAKRNTLIVVSFLDDLVIRATNNLQYVKAIFVKNLNVYDVMNADTIIISKKSLAIIEEWLGGNK